MLTLHALAVAQYPPGQTYSVMNDTVAVLVSSCRYQATSYVSAMYDSPIMNSMCSTNGTLWTAAETAYVTNMGSFFCSVPPLAPSSTCAELSTALATVCTSVETNCPGTAPPAPPMMPAAEMGEKWVEGCYLSQYYFSKWKNPSTPALDIACQALSSPLQTAYGATGPGTVPHMIGCSAPPGIQLNASNCDELASTMLMMCDSIVSTCALTKPATLQMPVTIASFTVAGTVSDFDAARLSAIEASVAASLSVHPSTVTASVIAGSVQLTTEIEAMDHSTASSHVTTLSSSILSSPAAASAALGVTVVSIDNTTATSKTLAGPAAAPSTPTTPTTPTASSEPSPPSAPVTPTTVPSNPAQVVVESGGQIRIATGGVLSIGSSSTADATASN